MQNFYFFEAEQPIFNVGWQSWTANPLLSLCFWPGLWFYSWSLCRWICNPNDSSSFWLFVLYVIILIIVTLLEWVVKDQIGNPFLGSVDKRSVICVSVELSNLIPSYIGMETGYLLYTRGCSKSLNQWCNVQELWGLGVVKVFLNTWR